MRNYIAAVLILCLSVLCYGQNINRIVIHHSSQEEVPFPVIILYSSAMVSDMDHPGLYHIDTLVIKDSSVFVQTLRYFNGDYFGKKGNSVYQNVWDADMWNKFAIYFYEDDKLSSRFMLHGPGAFFFFVQLYGYLVGDEHHRNEIIHMIYRL